MALMEKIEKSLEHKSVCRACCEEENQNRNETRSEKDRERVRERMRWSRSSMSMSMSLRVNGVWMLACCLLHEWKWLAKGACIKQHTEKKNESNKRNKENKKNKKKMNVNEGEQIIHTMWTLTFVWTASRTNHTRINVSPYLTHFLTICCRARLREFRFGKCYCTKMWHDELPICTPLNADLCTKDSIEILQSRNWKDVQSKCEHEFLLLSSYYKNVSILAHFSAITNLINRFSLLKFSVYHFHYFSVQTSVGMSCTQQNNHKFQEIHSTSWQRNGKNAWNEIICIVARITELILFFVFVSKKQESIRLNSFWLTLRIFNEIKSECR